MIEEERKKKRREAVKRYNAKNIEKVRERKRAHYHANKEQYKKRAEKFSKSETRKRWREENKDNIKEYHKKRWSLIKDKKPHLKSNYGITLDDYNNMFEQQNGCCLGCGKHQSDLEKPLCVDHDHQTGRVRGLLCIKCNSALGMVLDNIDTLTNLIKYLKS